MCPYCNYSRIMFISSISCDTNHKSLDHRQATNIRDFYEYTRLSVFQFSAVRIWQSTGIWTSESMNKQIRNARMTARAGKIFLFPGKLANFPTICYVFLCTKRQNFPSNSKISLQTLTFPTDLIIILPPFSRHDDGRNRTAYNNRSWDNADLPHGYHSEGVVGLV